MVLSAGLLVVATVFAQLSTTEAGALSTIRKIASGQMAFAAACGNGFFAPTLAILGRPEPGREYPFILVTDVPKDGAAVLERNGYRIEIVAKPSAKSSASCNGVAAGGLAETFEITARPVPGQSGRSFHVDTKGVITEGR